MSANPAVPSTPQYHKREWPTRPVFCSRNVCIANSMDEAEDGVRINFGNQYFVLKYSDLQKLPKDNPLSDAEFWKKRVKQHSYATVKGDYRGSHPRVTFLGTV